MILRLTDVIGGLDRLRRRRHRRASAAAACGATTRTVQGVFQDPFSSYNPIFKADRVFELIRRPFLPQLDDSEWTERLDVSLEAVGLNPSDVLDKYPHQLSGGQLQRLLIARALLLDLQLLVADEIISMLDASTRIDVLNLLGDLAARGFGLLFITHDLSLGHYISDRTVILRHGRVVETGATEKVFANPRHPYTKMLLASVPQLQRTVVERWLHPCGRARRRADRAARRGRGGSLRGLGAAVSVDPVPLEAPAPPGSRGRTGRPERSGPLWR